MKKGLSKAEKICLAGYYLTHDVDTAYRLSREGKQMTDKADILHKMALRWARSKTAKDFLSDLANVQLGQSADAHNRSKSDIVKELNQLANKTSDPKQRTDILLKLADLERMKEEKPTAEDDEPKIRYHLPVRYPTSCKDCLLHINGVTSIKEAQDRAARGEKPSFMKKGAFWGRKNNDKG